MASGIDLRTVSEVTGVPYPTLRYWVQEHGWQAIGSGPRGAKLYDAVMVRDWCVKHPEFQRRWAAERAA
jgi:hypothetical protein